MPVHTDKKPTTTTITITKREKDFALAQVQVKFRIAKNSGGVVAVSGAIVGIMLLFYCLHHAAFAGVVSRDRRLFEVVVRLVFVSKWRLFIRRLDQPKATELAGTEGASEPFFSPDGQWVAFVAQSKLKKIPVGGGAAIALCDTTIPLGGSWGEDGNIIATLALAGGPLLRIPSTGGVPMPVTELAPGEATHRWPQILPGRNAVLFTASPNASPGRERKSRRRRATLRSC